MASTRVVLCGGVAATNLPVRDRSPLRLSPVDTGGNVRHAVKQLRTALLRPLPPAFADLLEVATYVYCADQAVTRGPADDLGDLWRRRFFFRVPVRVPDVWAKPAVCDALRRVLSFLSDDEYEFEFVRRDFSDNDPQQQLTFPGTPYDGLIEDVDLFSGGLDSLGGAVENAVTAQRKVVLVLHRSNPKGDARLAELVRLLRERAGDATPAYLSITVNKREYLTDDSTQRSRSFLFAALGAAVAVQIGRDRVRFYENGVVSLNLPVSAQVIGARATRTTHPRVLAGFEALFSLLTDRPFRVENPFLWHTKADVVRGLAAAGCADLIRHSVSCAHTRAMERDAPHCGLCSQCIDRRFAVLAAGQGDRDPADGYRTDLFVGPRPEGVPRAMLAAYLETVRAVRKSSAVGFFARYGEAARVLRHLECGAQAGAARIHDLYVRHATDVAEVVDAQIRAAKRNVLDWQDYPPGCLLQLVTDTGSLPEDEPREPAPAGAEPEPAYIFRDRGGLWEYRYAGGPSCNSRSRSGPHTCTPSCPGRGSP